MPDFMIWQKKVKYFYILQKDQMKESKNHQEMPYYVSKLKILKAEDVKFLVEICGSPFSLSFINFSHAAA
jgi:hypothetical protein